MHHYETLNDLLDHHTFTLFLIDASGVIYNDDGLIDGIQKSIQKLQAIGKVMMVTNNASQYPTIISQSLKDKGIIIDHTDIISSGHGLRHDSDIYSLIQGKTIYLYGQEPSVQYILDCKCTMTRTIEQADAIIFTSSYRDPKKNTTEYNNIMLFCMANPEIPIVCCNPDRYVRGPNNRRLKVIGYFAEAMENELKKPILWIGKPHQNFSAMLDRHLKHRFPTTYRPENTIFFDDLLPNIQAMQRDIHIHGCLITATGLSSKKTVENLPTRRSHPNFTLPTLGQG